MTHLAKFRNPPLWHDLYFYKNYTYRKDGEICHGAKINEVFLLVYFTSFFGGGEGKLYVVMLNEYFEE